MTSAAMDHGHDAHAGHHTSLGIDNRKLAIWTFIGSECLFFATLISTFLIYRGQSVSGPTPKDIFEVPLVTGGTAILLFSSFFVVMALNGAQEGNRKKLLTWLSLTVLCGIFFAGMQVYEFSHFNHEGLGYSTNLFSASFYTLTLDSRNRKGGSHLGTRPQSAAQWAAAPAPCYQVPVAHQSPRL